MHYIGNELLIVWQTLVALIEEGPPNPYISLDKSLYSPAACIFTCKLAHGCTCYPRFFCLVIRGDFGFCISWRLGITSKV